MKLTLLFLATVLFSSCTYQYFELSGDPQSRNESNDFVVENDTLRVTYRFSGDHGPVKITIYNKSSEPLEINWRKSALIMNDQSFGYYSPNLFLNGTIRQDTLKSLLNYRSYSADVKANIYVNEPSQYIPPRSSISKVPLTLPVHSVRLPSRLVKKVTYTTVSNLTVQYKKMEYSSDKSPVSFRSYLNFNYGGQASHEFSIEHNFYVSEIWETDSDPGYFSNDILEKGNVFHISL